MIDDKAVMQQALDVLLSYDAEEFGAGQDVVVALRKTIAQSVKPHNLQKRLEALDFYEDIAEFYAKCAISPEGLRDWVAERMDMPVISQPKETK